MSHRAPALTPENSLFILVSFEGPDRYAQAGGLAVRVTGLAERLARLGYETHLVFVGDPTLPGEEHRLGQPLVLHRWAQWVPVTRGPSEHGSGGRQVTRSFTRVS